MAVIRRPYFVVHNGIEHMVEATQPAGAVQHVVGQSITELRPARASEILAWTRAGKPIAVARQKAEPAGETKAAEEDPKWHAGDCAIWIGEQEGDVEAALEIWKKIVLEGCMMLEDFDAMREAVPMFADAMFAHAPDLDSEAPALAARLREHLEEAPMPLAAVVKSVGDQKRRELYVPDAAEANEQAVLDS